MKEIPLTQGKVALVDDEDYEALVPYKWCSSYNRYTKSFYALRRSPSVDGKQGSSILMHRSIVDAKRGDEVDHEDHDTLNNQRYNLRLTNNGGNHRNMRQRCDNTSGCTGVYWHKQIKKWTAYITVGRRTLNLGSFSDKQDAIESRQAANIKYGFHPNHGRKLQLT